MIYDYHFFLSMEPFILIRKNYYTSNTFSTSTTLNFQIFFFKLTSQKKIKVLISLKTLASEECIALIRISVKKLYAMTSSNLLWTFSNVTFFSGKGALYYIILVYIHNYSTFLCCNCRII